jgi:hypothetical protein
MRPRGHPVEHRYSMLKKSSSEDASVSAAFKLKAATKNSSARCFYWNNLRKWKNIGRLIEWDEKYQWPAYFGFCFSSAWCSFWGRVPLSTTGPLNLHRPGRPKAQRLIRTVKDLAVRLFLGPSWRGVFKILLASVGRCIKKAVRVGKRFSATRVRRVGVKKIITQTKEYA